MTGTRYLVGEKPYEPVALVVVAVAIVAFEVMAVLRQCATILSHYIKVVAPCVTHAGTETVPALRSQSSLQRVVVCYSNALELVDRISADQRIGADGCLYEGRISSVGYTHSRINKALVDIEQAQEMASLATDISKLHHYLAV